MKKIYYRLLSLPLLFSMFLLCLFPTSAACATSQESSVSTLLVEQDQLDMLIPESVSYQYKIIDVDSEEKVASVQMVVTFKYGNETSNILTVGDIPYYTLSNGRQYFSGPLYGTITRNNIDYNLIIGFQKFNDNSDIKATVTIEADEDCAIFNFGELYVAYDEVQEVFNTEQTISEPNNAIESRGTSRDYEYLSSTSNKLNGKVAIKQDIYYNEEYQRVAVNTLPYINNVESIYDSSAISTIDTYVNAVQIVLRPTSTSKIEFGGLVYSEDQQIPSNMDKDGVADAILGFADILFDDLSTITSLVNILRNMAGVGLGAPNGTIEQDYVNLASVSYSNLSLSDDSWDDYGFVFGVSLRKVGNTPLPAYGTININSELEYKIVIVDKQSDVSTSYRTVSTSSSKVFDIQP